jgi:hypothetical protein
MTSFVHENLSLETEMRRDQITDIQTKLDAQPNLNLPATSNIETQLSKIAAFTHAPQAHIMWDGGCNGGIGHGIGGNPTFEECNAACNKFSWCDKFVYNEAEGGCWVNSKECS